MVPKAQSGPSGGRTGLPRPNRTPVLYTECHMDMGSSLPVIMAAGAAVILLVAALWIRARRSLVRRVLAVAARLDDKAVSMDGRGGKEAALDRLERSAERAHSGSTKPAATAPACRPRSTT